MDAQTVTVDRWIAVASVVVTMIGVLLTVVFYRRSISKPKLTYSVDPLHVRLVDKSRVPVTDLDILYDGKPIDRDVTATTVYFWNDGTAAVRKGDVLKPHIIAFDEESESWNAGWRHKAGTFAVSVFKRPAVLWCPSAST